MARNFTTAANTAARFDIGQSSADVFGPYTAAVKLKVATFAANVAFVSARTSGAVGRWEFGCNGPNDAPFVYDGTIASNASFVLGTADGWIVVAVTKATGTVTPFFHKYVYATKTWTHSVGDTAVPNVTSAGAGGIWAVGYDDATSCNADIAQVGYENRVLSDMEVERLASQPWDRHLTRFCVEFPPGNPSSRAVPRDQGRGLSALTSNTGVVISADNPPSTQYSRYRRRR